MSVSGNFGKYGGAHPTHATLVGAASKYHGQVLFRGVIRAPEAARTAINATSNDTKAEVRRRMDHGSEAYMHHGRMMLPRHPGTRRAPMELISAPDHAHPRGVIRDTGFEYYHRGGTVPPGAPAQAPAAGILAPHGYGTGGGAAPKAAPKPAKVDSRRGRQNITERQSTALYTALSPYRCTCV